MNEKRGLSDDDVSLNTGINKQELIDIRERHIIPQCTTFNDNI